MLLKYFNNLNADNKDELTKEYGRFMHQKMPKDVIYGGKIKLASQNKKKVNLDPPRVYPPTTSTGIKLYKG